MKNRHQFQIVLVALIPAVVAFFVNLKSESTVGIEARLGTLAGNALILMLLGLITYKQASKKLLDQNDETGMIKARGKAFIVIVVTYIVLFLVNY